MGESLLTGASELLLRIAGDVGTPVYVYDAREIRAQYHRLSSAFGHTPHRICYSIKANGNLAVLALLRQLGAGADIVSRGELARALRVGFAPDQIVFSGVGKTRAELSEALDVGVGLINVESLGELETLRETARSCGVVARVGIRVNPEVTAETHPYTQTAGKGIKFGVPVDQVVPMAWSAVQGGDLRLTSIGMHIGSQILDPKHFEAAALVLRGIVEQLQEAGIDSLESVDLGGGLGIRYNDEAELTAEAFAHAVRPLTHQVGLTVLIEPGRFLVGTAGLLLTRCLYRKHSGGKDLVVVDAGMNDLLRPALYRAVHRILLVDGDCASSDLAARMDVVGPVCETGDFLGLDRHLPGVAPGALLAVLGVGAYGFSMSSTYNSRPRAPEVLVDDGRWAVIREREQVDDLMRGETATPSWREWTT